MSNKLHLQGFPSQVRNNNIQFSKKFSLLPLLFKNNKCNNQFNQKPNQEQVIPSQDKSSNSLCNRNSFQFHRRIQIPVSRSNKYPASLNPDRTSHKFQVTLCQTNCNNSRSIMFKWSKCSNSNQYINSSRRLLYKLNQYSNSNSNKCKLI